MMFLWGCKQGGGVGLGGEVLVRAEMGRGRVGEWGIGGRTYVAISRMRRWD